MNIIESPPAVFIPIHFAFYFHLKSRLRNEIKRKQNGFTTKESRLPFIINNFKVADYNQNDLKELWTSIQLWNQIKIKTFSFQIALYWDSSCTIENFSRAVLTVALNLEIKRKFSRIPLTHKVKSSFCCDDEAYAARYLLNRKIQNIESMKETHRLIMQKWAEGGKARNAKMIALRRCGEVADK